MAASRRPSMSTSLDCSSRDTAASSAWAEAWSQLRIALPLFGANLLQRSGIWVEWACVGHLGADFLGPASFASSVNNVVGFSLVGGLSLGISTLASQAHGAGDDVALSRVLQRGILMCVLGSVPAVLVLLLMTPLLLVLGMDARFASRAGSYSLCIVMVTPMQGVQRSIAIWLASRKITAPWLVIQLIVVPFRVGVTMYLTFRTPLAYLGAGVSNALTNLLQTAMLYAYLSYAPSCARAWEGFTREACREWGALLRVALPGVFMLSEYFVGESLSFAASRLPDANACLSAFSIYQLTQTTCFQFPSGMRTAVTARVGSLLGAGQGDRAMAAHSAGLRLIMLWILIPTSIFLSFTHEWGSLFTGDVVVIQMLCRLVYCMLLYSSADACVGFYNGVLSACGQQRISGRYAVIGYVFIGLPLALCLSFPLGLGIDGLLWGHLVGKCCHLAPIMLGVRRLDWQCETERARARVRQVSRTVALTARS